MRIRHILCAIDVANQSDHVFHAALRLAVQHGSRLTLVHAVHTRELFNENSRPRRRRLAALLKTGRAQGVTVDLAVQQGDPAGVILLHAKARAVDLVVVGTDGRRGRGRTGGVAEAVGDRATCPTLVVPPPDHASTRPSGPIVTAVGLGAASAATIEHALETAGPATPESPSLVFLHVVDSLPADAAPRYGWRAPDQQYRQYLHLSAFHRLQALIPSRARALGTTRTRIMAGNPALQIAAVARELDARLIVIGATGGAAWRRRFFRTSVARIIGTASRPVLIVPARVDNGTSPVEARDLAA